MKVSVIGLGTNQFGSKRVDGDAGGEIIRAALDSGVNFIDTANNYSSGRSEETIGSALEGLRDRVVLATKFWAPVGEGPNERGSSRYHIMRAVEDSLRRLRTDHIDLYYAHRWDESTPIEETLRALDDLITAGKVRYIGASEFASWQLARANLLSEVQGWHRFVVVQSHYHLFERGAEREVLPYCIKHRTGFVPFYPLAGGFLSGKYKENQPHPRGSRVDESENAEYREYVSSYMTHANFGALERLRDWARQHDHTLAELALAWLLAQEGVCAVIPGATRVEHVRSNAAAGDWVLDAADLDEIESLLEPAARD